MKEYTQEERERAFAFIDAAIERCEIVAHNNCAYDAPLVDAICDLNRAVELLKQVQQEGRTTSFLARAGEFIAHHGGTIDDDAQQ